MSLPFCACRASGPFPRSAEREIPARKRRIANATRVHHVKDTEERAAARLRRIAYATRVHRRTGCRWIAVKSRLLHTNYVCVTPAYTV